MWRLSSALAALLLTASVASAQFTTTDRDTVLWYFPQVSGTNAPTQVTRLRAEVQKILDAGHCLMPAYAYHEDEPAVYQWWIYTIPGRIITTLAWAYPYLTAAQQTAVDTYVTDELTKTGYRPWDTSPLTPTTACGSGSAVRRELFPVTKTTYKSYWTSANTFPSVQTIYGLWLWGWRKGGTWTQISPYWSSIQTMYTARASQGNLYGTMGAHIGMARLAQANPGWANAASVQTTATNNLLTALTGGTSLPASLRTFATVEGYVSGSYWSVQYQNARKQDGQYLGWMFLDISPEIARYLATSSGCTPCDNARTRHASPSTGWRTGKTKYPWWWMRQMPIYTTASGDDNYGEGYSFTPEIIGMIAPLERYTVGASSTTMLGYTRSGPLVIGDLYWIELLVYAIEATGTTTWVDVRNGVP